jgi:hypothetical protein
MILFITTAVKTSNPTNFFFASLPIHFSPRHIIYTILNESIDDKIFVSNEIESVQQSPDIVIEIKIRRLEWLVQVIRMEGTPM